MIIKHADEMLELTDQAEIITAIWNHINRLVSTTRHAAGFDENGMARALAWKSDADCPAWRMTRIQAVLAWSDQAWMLYYQFKAMVEAGLAVELPTALPDACPYAFRDLLFE